MEKLFSYLEKVTGVNNLENRSWQDVVDNVILPMMAYPANRRNRIGNAFMKFMAEFTQDVCRKDEHLGNIMLEIAMQRISDGAVLHPDDPTPTFEALPQAYRTYGSQNGYLGGEPGLMGKECEDFIVNALPVCLEHAKTRSHALAIAFGLVHYLNEDGEEQEGYMLDSVAYAPNGKLLYTLAKQWAEKYADEETIFRHYAQPNQWRKHIAWFAEQEKAEKLDWENFFAATKAAGEGNFFKRWQNKLRIQKEIRACALNLR